MKASAVPTVVLVGGGHAHVQVLRRWAMKPPPNVRVMVVLDRPIAVYSGMVPGFVAGDYPLGELEIDIVPLARRAGAGVIFSAARDIDPVRREILFADRPPLPFDIASLDTGSSVRGLDTEGVREHALATRPIGRFVGLVDAEIERLRAMTRQPRIVVVGSGAAGCELALTLEARLRASGVDADFTLVSSDAQFGVRGKATQGRLEQEMKVRGVLLEFGQRVVRVDANGIICDPAPAKKSGAGAASHLTKTSASTQRPADLVIWATGAAPTVFPSHAASSRLRCDAKGFIEIRDTLQTTGFDHVFAVGDCARLVDHAWVPRAGVYAVRQGPVLEANLRAALGSRPLTPYRPQRDFLALLHLGDGRALGSKWGLAIQGSAALKLKDWIDRRFMARFQLLDEDGLPRASAGLPPMASDEDEEMQCGGCAAKLGALPLDAALSALPKAPADDSVVLGLAARDDVAATRDHPGGPTRLHNVDVIRAFCDDPYLVGQVAATNALSDLHAKGGMPRHAQAIIGLPDLEPQAAAAMLVQTLSGLRAILDPLHVSLLGGHTTLGDALTVGLSVTGDGPAEGELLRQSGARVGDRLILTQPLGTGVVLAADMQGLARAEWVQAAHAVMTRPNDPSGQLAWQAGAHAATDVTGFGFAGHLLTLLDDAELEAVIDSACVPMLPGAEMLWQHGLRSTAHPANHAAFASRVDANARGGEAPPLTSLSARPSATPLSETFENDAWLFDPQTSGGLILAVAPETVGALRDAFAAAGEPPIADIGYLRHAAEVAANGEPDASNVVTPKGRILIDRASPAEPTQPADLPEPAATLRPL